MRKSKRKVFLKSLTAAEELAVFLSLRGNCLKEAGRLNEATTSYAKASQLAPGWNTYRALLADSAASTSPSLASGKFVNPPQTRVADEPVFPNPSVISPDPNPLKQMNGQ
jgi:hypothetical protein